jgi:hypothetical protein
MKRTVDMVQKTPTSLENAKRLMAALGSMPPKPHEEMKLGKSKRKPAKSPKLNKCGLGKRDAK